MRNRPSVCGFLKVRNEIVREGNLYRVLRNLDAYCDAAVVCDDASSDGTRAHLVDWVRQRGGRVVAASAHGADEVGPGNPRWTVVLVPPDQQAFTDELRWKQHMLTYIHQVQPRWVFWMDGDEVLDAAGTRGFRRWVEEVAEGRVEQAWRFHYTQVWRSAAWARTDAGFDDGAFIKLWRWTPDLAFDVRPGTHHHQFPQQVLRAVHLGLVGRAPYEVIHYGNYGKNLVWKCLQYYGGLGDVDRHLLFSGATYRPVPREQVPDEAEWAPGAPPAPFTETEIARIRAMAGLRRTDGWFTVVIPAYNRADTLPRALDSVLAQTYEAWVAVVLDDGSTDDTPALMRYYQDRDPRIFYARYPTNRGGVAMNEIGMALACEWGEYWTRLGSDDWWGPAKLAHDAVALRQYPAVYGPYVVERGGQLAEWCNAPRPLADTRTALLSGVFVASWANCAVRTEVLRAVRARYGTFCDPRLRNMEDFLVNARVARHTGGWAWRGVVAGRLVVAPEAPVAFDPVVEAGWRAADSGASGDVVQTMQDEVLTRRLINEENVRYGHDTLTGDG